MLGDVPMLLMADWTETYLYEHIYSILQRNDVPWQGNKLQNRWTHKFVKCAMTWKKLLEQGAAHTPAEWLSLFGSALPFDELPRGSNRVDEWSRAHAPSVLAALYRGIPAKYRASRGEGILLEKYIRFVLDTLQQESALEVKQTTPHEDTLIQAFDAYVEKFWILQPQPLTAIASELLKPVEVIHSMRDLLFNHILYREACSDLHPGLMADIAGRWFCDYYFIPGPEGYFTGNDIGRYVADVLNPYHLLSMAHKRTFVHNGLQLRQKYKRVFDPRGCFEQCMAEPATDVACESTFTMLLINIISCGKPINGLELKPEDVPRDQFVFIPDDMKAGKSLFRMQDRLLRESMFASS